MTTESLTFEQWKTKLDGIADLHNLTPKENPSPAEVARWRDLYDAGKSPHQAWNAVPFERESPAWSGLGRLEQSMPVEDEEGWRYVSAARARRLRKRRDVYVSFAFNQPSGSAIYKWRAAS